MTQDKGQHALFPVQMNAYWCDAQAFSLSEHLRNWLLEPSSLTARLKQHCTKFRVQLLGQHVVPCAVDEATEEIVPGQAVLVREVILHCDEQPAVFARSLLPLTSLTGNTEQLANLGEQPLGQVIFNHPYLQRKRIEIAEFLPDSTVAKLAQHCQLKVTGSLWGRRSVFILDNKPLLVGEVFLPNAVAYDLERVS